MKKCLTLQNYFIFARILGFHLKLIILNAFHYNYFRFHFIVYDFYFVSTLYFFQKYS